MHVSGPFDVTVTAQEDKSPDPLMGRMTLDKQYHGELEASGKGQMLTAGTEVKGSGAYVAIEHVAGTLKGRTGTFVLQHSGTMNQNVPQLSITVVPDSGTGQLKGISGKMTITIAAGGKHSYDFEYTLPDGN
jgi:LDH2 family malate/lactate/ureidoglycolate dehydrogenase